MAQPLRILIIDDSPEDREVYRRRLAQGCNCEFREAETGEAGLELCRTWKPDCVLLDYSLPDVDGLECLRDLRAETGAGGVAVVMLTGQGNETVAVQALQAGAQDYLGKNVTAQALCRAVQDAVDKVTLLRRVEEQRRQLEHTAQALGQSQERLLLAEQAGRIGSFEWDVRTNTVAWSGAAEELYGLPPGSFGGRYENWLRSVHPDDRDRVEAAMQGAGADRIALQTEFRAVWPDGSIHWIAAQGKVFADGTGEPRRMLGVTMDLTERKRAEEALQEANRRKDEFLAMLAHELRNPLAPIRNAVHLLRLRGNDPAVIEQARDMIDRQVSHMARLVDDLLDVSRITRGKIALKNERLDLARLVAAAAGDLEGSFAGSGVRLQVQAPETPLWVKGDRTRLTQVIDNLLDNARKFTERGGAVTVELSAEPGTGRIALRVHDTGIGIEPAMLARLFEPFSQADRSLERSRGGLGLGLALVKGLVELHGGTIEVRSAGLGHGTEFCVSLPREREPAALSQVPARIAQLAKRRRILVVEDNRDAADSLRMLLETYGCEVAVAYNGPEGVAAARRSRPDVVLCDIGLPGMDGYAVARALRQDQGTAGARLIAVTGYGQEEDRLRALASGFDCHLVKPADPSRLLELVQQ